MHRQDSTPTICMAVHRAFCHKYQRSIDLEGRIYKILDVHLYRTHILKLCSLILIGFLARIIRRFPYFPITVVGNTVYSQVAAAALDRCSIPYALCRSNYRITYYETDEHQEIPLEGSSPSQFPPKTVSLIPLSDIELSQLEAHTGLAQLSEIQTSILTPLQRKDLVTVVDMSELLDHHPHASHFLPIMKIQKLAGNICYVRTMNAIWLTRLIITDSVTPLQPGDVVTGLYGTITPDPSEHAINLLDQVFNHPATSPSTIYQVVNTPTTCTVVEGDTTTVFQRWPLYQILPDLTIKSIKPDQGSARESIIYHLDRPRPFNKAAPIIHVHPFHLPPSWDPFLSIMIITQGLVQDIRK